MKYILFAFALISINGFSAAPPDTIWNHTDNKDWKQGYWKKYYPNGQLLYKGYFRDDSPVGKMQRFYEDGKIKGELIYTGEDETTYAIMYFRNGQKGAKGKYIGQKRDSIWNYYSYYTGTLTYRESYRMGLKDGPSTKYYSEGTLAEVIHWKNDVKQGAWEQFYEDSTLRLSSRYEADQLHGKYHVFNQEQVLILEGAYKMGKMDGEWKFYDDEGNLKRRLRYRDGDILDKKELDKWREEFMDNVEKNLGKIPEPDLNNFFERKP